MSTSKPISTAPLITELERVAREAIRHFRLSVTPTDLIFTIQSKGAKHAVGWFASNRWTNGKDKDGGIHEINLSAEHLRDYDAGEVVLHELAHAENFKLGIRDCSGRLHNAKFKVMAERLGLTVGPRTRTYGFGFTKLGPEGEAFLNKIKFKRELFQPFRTLTVKDEKKGSRLVKVECGECGYTARVTRKWLETGNLICPCDGETELEES